jgi:osomolarity two-component system sensor histidine kinase CHK1
MATIFGAHELAIDITTYCCEPLLPAVRGTGYAAWVGFYSSISFLERYRYLTDQQKEMLARSMREYREWSGRAKATWLHKSVLLEAEMMRVTDAGQQLEILDRFDHAISLANKSGFTHDSALINERCGLWLRGFSKRRAAPYLREAFRGWSTWGAVNKAADLRRQFPDDILFKGNQFLTMISLVLRLTICRKPSNNPRPR